LSIENFARSTLNTLDQSTAGDIEILEKSVDEWSYGCPLGKDDKSGKNKKANDNWH